MPVPVSYNDITESQSLADHIGTVWYDRRFFVSTSWANNTRVWIHFVSVHYEAQVVCNRNIIEISSFTILTCEFDNFAEIQYVNGIMVLKHEIGHLPFETDITNVLKYRKEIRLAISHSGKQNTLKCAPKNRCIFKRSLLLCES